MERVSQLEGQVKLNHRQGFFLFMVVQVLGQTHLGRKIVYDARPPFGGPGATLGLDDDDALFFEVRDSNGQAFATPAVPKEALGEAWHILCCGLEHHSGRASRLFVEMDGRNVADREISGEWGGETEVPTSLGASVVGTDAAAFSLTALTVLSVVPSPEQRALLLAYARETYALGEGTTNG